MTEPIHHADTVRCGCRCHEATDRTQWCFDCGCFAIVVRLDDGWAHDDLCESENVHGHDTPCWCEERAVLIDGYLARSEPKTTNND